MTTIDPKDVALRELGFVRISLYRGWDYPLGNNEASFIPATDIRYLHHTVAVDGTRLYAYSWISEPGFLLTTERHISALEHMVAELETDNIPLLKQQVEKFFLRHGGMGPQISTAVHRPLPQLS
ncbi:hypothetical protein [Hymenobacter swuensis]|uniref:Uncharacterized protein n=1 Tax=Hymenobacter swuensis DY53 TaxID=1227739 RepID=W8FDY3_9BACT|nr:hypothetical protein [Hymenobacter swuensis]AHJ99895.1 hypothetical protein Hsw_4300 [Hymenobacter swuensis DY53]